MLMVERAGHTGNQKDCVYLVSGFAHNEMGLLAPNNLLIYRPNPVEIGLIKAYKRHIQDHGASDLKKVPFNA